MRVDFLRRAWPGLLALTCVAPPVALAAAPCPPGDRPRIAEVLYDPAGDDAGREFVELFHPGAVEVSLAGVKLESGDGSSAGRWTLRWTGGVADHVPPRGRFVIGGARVEPRPDAESELSLQNGPDAVRLTWPDGTVEVVGYGAHDFAEYSCGEPAADAPSGFSLARVPDDASSGDNAADWRPATPSPGRANQAARDLAWVRGSLALDPEQPPPNGPALLSGRVTNPGREGVEGGIARLIVTRASAGGDAAWAEADLVVALASGDSATVVLPLAAAPEGRHALVARVAVAGDEAPANDADTLSVRIGPGPVEITEIQFHPATGEGEWVELMNRSREGVDPARLRLADRADRPGRPAGGSRELAPGGFALFAQDRAALLARYPAIDSAWVWQVSPWPSLNNSDDETGSADAAIVREEDGTRVARADYSAKGVPAGVPLERRDGAFWPAVDAGGSPLAPPPAPRAVPGRFEVAPRRVTSRGARFAWELPWPVARVSVDLYDLSGARIATAIPEAEVPGRGERAWIPEGLASGLYVAVLRARAGTPGEVVHATRALRIEGGAR